MPMSLRLDEQRVVDESEEDYLYPESYFIFVELPRKAQEAFVAKENLDVR